MRKSWLAGLLAGWLAADTPVHAEDPVLVAAVAAPVRPDDAVLVAPVTALVPETPSRPCDRPTELPNIDPRLDIQPLIRTPSSSKPASPEPKRTPLRDRLYGDYDPSYLFLPDRNPGARQPPCPCLPLGTWWLNAAYFLGVTESGAVPPLVTAGGNGVPGAPGVTVVHANDRLEQPFRSGLRLEGGTWLDRCQNWGIDGSFFFMQSTQAHYEASSPGNPLLARPFTAQPGGATLLDVLAAPGLGQGAVSVNSPLTFLGADVNSRWNVRCEDKFRLDFLAGYRFIRMTEQVAIHSHAETIGGASSDVDDSYRTVNFFNGAQIGLAGEWRFERLYIAGSTKIAFGANCSSLDVEGQTRLQAPGAAPVVTPGGLLAARANLGVTHETAFAVAPEANFIFGYQVAEHWRAYLGYTFVYVSSVARPGQAIDLNVGSNTAARNDGNSEFWMHGINFGVEARY